MRIVHVIATLAAEEGGPSRAVLDMALASARKGHAVKILTTDYGGARLDCTAALEGGVEIETHPVEFPRQWKRSTALRAALERTIPGADLVHLHSLYLYHCLVTGRVCRRASVPYLVRPHGTLDPFLQQRNRRRKAVFGMLFQNRVTDGAAGLHFTTEEEQLVASPYARGQKGFVVPLPVDTTAFQDLPGPDAFRQRFPETRDRRIILFMSRLNFKKGLDLLVQAFASLARSDPSLHLVLAGPDDGMKGSVDTWLREARVRDRATFTGMLRGQDKLAALAAAEVFVLPSYSENFGLAITEAMACELPVVVSDKVNLWGEIVEAGAGLVTETKADAVSCALRQTLADPEKGRAQGRNGRRHVETAYSLEAVGAKLDRMYHSVVSAATMDRP